MIKRLALSILLLLALVIAGAALVLLIPFKTTLVPEWQIKIIDDAGKPFADAKVVQQWSHITYGVADSDVRKADKNGYVTFPMRTFTSSLLYRILRLASARLSMSGGGSGIQASVFAKSTTTEQSSESIYYKPEEPLPTEIILGR